MGAVLGTSSGILKRFENIEKAIHVAFDKEHDSARALAKVIHFQGRIVVGRIRLGNPR
jgi:hypothetical protein